MSTAQHIVIVDDDQWLGESYSAILSKAGYETRHVLHALDAIDAVDEHAPVAIVLDVLLVGTTAFTLLHELQSHADLAKIPIVLVTNLAADMTLDNVRSYGVVELLDKTTLLPRELVAAVHRAVS